ncbi:hypothetical protein MLP_30410 [Microlunatus phosphovorus NM-1]|uniref:Uncharacterized protein n=2 Tax=Microlunatus phosphovorus TaxID=29405 RepID=F5XKI3_MICPN|nr:hypothetical protein MLP_30410 [Microlunatus phosphovorus NM-1]
MSIMNEPITAHTAPDCPTWCEVEPSEHFAESSTVAYQHYRNKTLEFLDGDVILCPFTYQPLDGSPSAGGVEIGSMSECRLSLAEARGLLSELAHVIELVEQGESL